MNNEPFRGGRKRLYDKTGVRSVTCLASAAGSPAWASGSSIHARNESKASARILKPRALTAAHVETSCLAWLQKPQAASLCTPGTGGCNRAGADQRQEPDPNREPRLIPGVVQRGDELRRVRRQRRKDEQNVKWWDSQARRATARPPSGLRKSARGRCLSLSRQTSASSAAKYASWGRRYCGLGGRSPLRPLRRPRSLGRCSWAR